jgi:hypothetical protein
LKWIALVNALVGYLNPYSRQADLSMVIACAHVKGRGCDVTLVPLRHGRCKAMCGLG